MSIFGTHSASTPASNPLHNPRLFDTSGAFQRGIATHYGPNPFYIPGSEAGYQPNAVGVGCSNGPDDQNWSKLLAKGVFNVTRYEGIEKSTVWPTTPTVAVSEYSWKRNEICWKTVKIRNAENHSLAIDAIVVDFCPSQGCLWKRLDRAWNVDIYGIFSFHTLGGNANAGSLKIEIAWPPGIMPDTSYASRLSISFYTLSFTGLLALLV